MFKWFNRLIRNLAPKSDPEIPKDPWVPIASPSGSDQGFIRASAIYQCNPLTAQVQLTWIDHRGQRVVSCKPYDYDRGEYLKLLGIRRG